VPFDLSEPEKYLYDQVTKYINKYLGKAKASKQRWLWLNCFATTFMSSLNAIFSSLKKAAAAVY